MSGSPGLEPESESQSQWGSLADPPCLAWTPRRGDVGPGLWSGWAGAQEDHSDVAVAV